MNCLQNYGENLCINAPGHITGTQTAFPCSSLYAVVMCYYQLTAFLELVLF